mmetsp:Transcript_46990/g.134413  ORF Transcript_46990/g.134413 Transcript_46990/m.134413 type:complete len:248 (-) Transcript_46990:598-1341(-)
MELIMAANCLDHLLVLVESHLEALVLKELGSTILPVQSQLHLVFIRSGPHLLALAEADHLQTQNDLWQVHLAQAKLRLLHLPRHDAGHEAVLASLHVPRCALDHITDISFATSEAKLLRPREAWDSSAGGIGRGVHAQHHIEAVLGPVVALPVLDGLLHDRPILQHRDVARVVDFMQCELDVHSAVALALVDIVLCALQRADFVLAHLFQGLVDHPAQVLPEVRGAYDVVDLIPILNQCIALRRGLQ